MSNAISLTVYGKAEPQGSAKGFVVKGRAIITSDNAKLKPYRQQVTQMAMEKVCDACLPLPFIGKHVPVKCSLDFYFAKPDSAPKRRLFPVVKPDLDKLVRATHDALKGALYVDDAQIICESNRKHYGIPERVVIQVEVVE